MFTDLVSEFEKETSEAAGDGFRQRYAACVLQGEAVLLTYALNRAHLSFAVVTKKGEEPFAFNGAELSGGQRLCRDFIDAVGEGCVESENGPGAGDANDHLTVLRATGRKLQISAANQIEAAGILALSEESRLRREADGTGDEFEVGQNRAAKRAEPSGPTIGACCTAYWRLTANALLPPGCGRDDSQVRHFRAFHTVCRCCGFVDVMGLTLGL